MRVSPRARLASNLSGQTLALVMAGGNGTRLGALTRWHSKPSLPFGGQYRNIDFPLSNCVNSGIRRIALLTQYKAHSLIQHVHAGWSFLRPEVGEFVEIWPAQQRRGREWYAGTADAIYQNLDLIQELAPERVLVLAGDHIYRMDYLEMLEAHVDRGVGITVGAVEVPPAAASCFGIMSIDSAGTVLQFNEKPERATPLPEDPTCALASMGIYVFETTVLADCLRADAADRGSAHDFGHNVLPRAIDTIGVAAHVFRDPATGRCAYWRDVGTLDSYWRSNMELLTEPPVFDLHDRRWPLWTRQPQSPPPQFVGAGSAVRSIVSNGCRIAGRVDSSLLSPDCRVEPGARIEDSVILANVTIGRDSLVQRAVVDGGVTIPAGMVIGARSLDAAHYEVSPAGITLVTADALARATARATKVA